jgi:hypothetical protein
MEYDQTDDVTLYASKVGVVLLRYDDYTDVFARSLCTMKIFFNPSQRRRLISVDQNQMTAEFMREFVYRLAKWKGVRCHSLGDRVENFETNRRVGANVVHYGYGSSRVYPDTIPNRDDSIVRALAERSYFSTPEFVGASHDSVSNAVWRRLLFLKGIPFVDWFPGIGVDTVNMMSLGFDVRVGHVRHEEFHMNMRLYGFDPEEYDGGYSLNEDELFLPIDKDVAHYLDPPWDSDLDTYLSELVASTVSFVIKLPPNTRYTACDYNLVVSSRNVLILVRIMYRYVEWEEEYLGVEGLNFFAPPHWEGVPRFGWRQWKLIAAAPLERGLVNRDIMRVPLGGEFSVALYSISNDINDYHMTFERTCEIARNGIVMLPNRRYLDTEGSTEAIMREANFADWTYDPLDFVLRGFGVSHPIDLAYSILPKDELMKMHAVANPRSISNHRWFAVYPIHWLPEVETYLTNENYYFKSMSNSFRLSHGMDRDVIRRMRTRLLRRVGEAFDSWINGVVVFEGKRFVVSISGHIGGIMLRSLYDTYDLNRLLRFIEGSAKGGTDLEGIPYDGPWHSVLEWILGLYAVLPILDNVNVRPEVYDYIIGSLICIGKRTPSLMFTPLYTLHELKQRGIRVESRVKKSTLPMIHFVLQKLSRYHKVSTPVLSLLETETKSMCKDLLFDWYKQVK